MHKSVLFTRSHAQDVQDASSLQIIGDEALLGTLDLYAIRAMPGEVLIGAPLPLLLFFSRSDSAWAGKQVLALWSGNALPVVDLGHVAKKCFSWRAHVVLSWHAGDCSNPAYLANVCVTKAAQRQGVGRQLIHSAVDLANQWSASAHNPCCTLAVA